jgi:hypothetical protein
VTRRRPRSRRLACAGPARRTITTTIIETEDLVRSFDDVEALQAIDLAVEEATICGLPGLAWIAAFLAVFVPLGVRRHRKAV